MKPGNPGEPRIIPVLDLRNGQVVHARAGLRQEYQPICSTLCDSSDPPLILAALLEIHPFPEIYVADLGAILGEQPHVATVAALAESCPAVTFWIDDGNRCSTPYPPGTRRVIGSESGVDPDTLRRLKRSGGDFILSLDYAAHGFVGNPAILKDPGCWPQDVIVMGLTQVGMEAGPGWLLAEEVRARRPGGQWFLAGGIRDMRDVQEAGRRGYSGVLVATALHRGMLSRRDFTSAKKTPA